MTEHHSILDTTINGVEKLRNALKKEKSIQIRSVEEKSFIKATALAWFDNKHRSPLLSAIGESSLKSADDHFKTLLLLADKACTRNKVDQLLKEIKASLTILKSEKVTQLSSALQQNSKYNPPNFSTLVTDKEMVAILERRWKECVICVTMKAPLSAIVMMGGLLETLLLTRFLQFTDKKSIFKTKAVPKDKSGTALQFRDWVLKNYIEVAHELGWISQTEKDLGEVLREYRNYIHPFKEKSHGLKIEPKDSNILWEVTKSISRQIINFKNP